MKLRNKGKAYVPAVKLLDYLLSETHSVGKAKAKYLRSMGFNETNVHLLKEELLAVARSEDAVEAINTAHGVKYVIDGCIQTPIGISIKMRTIWIIDSGQERPRFVTAYPMQINCKREAK